MADNDIVTIRKPMQVVVLVQPGCPLSSISIPLDVFSTADKIWRRIVPRPEPVNFEVKLVSVDGKPVSAMGGVPIGVHSAIHEVATPDLIFIAAISENLSAAKQLPSMVSWIREKHQSGCRVASLCTGTFVLAATGLLDGKTATTHWCTARLFSNMYPKVRLLPHRLITDESPLYTSGGSHGAMDLCLYLVEQLLDRKTALNWCRVLVKDCRNDSQSPYAVFLGNRQHADTAIASIQDFLEEGYATALSVGQLAGRVGMGKRTFERRFKAATGESPVVYLQRLRVEAAKRILEMESESVEQITLRVGYEDAATFSKLFSRYVGISPAAYRRKFSPREASAGWPIPQ